MQRRHWANEATGIRYADMYDRIQRNNALTKYATAFDTSSLGSLLGSADWISTLYAGDDAATIRRHSTMAVLGGDEVTSKRLVGRSVWNDRWLLVIPASSLSSDRVNALKTFIHGLDTNKDGRVDVPGVSDIQIGFRAYSRSGN